MRGAEAMDALQPHARGVGVVHDNLCKLLGEPRAIEQVCMRQSSGACYDREYAIQHILQADRERASRVSDTNSA